jgi:hypothetical protein
MHNAAPNLYDPNTAANWLALPLCIWEIPGLNLGLATGYPDKIFLYFPSHFRQICNRTLTTHFQLVPCPSEFRNHPSIQCNIIYAAKKAPFSKPRIHQPSLAV